MIIKTWTDEESYLWYREVKGKQVIDVCIGKVEIPKVETNKKKKIKKITDVELKNNG